jgi:hypothetical protein
MLVISATTRFVAFGIAVVLVALIYAILTLSFQRAWVKELLSLSDAPNWVYLGNVGLFQARCCVSSHHSGTSHEYNFPKDFDMQRWRR